MHKQNLVVSDASPLIQLAIAGHLSLLPKIYRVAITEQVFEETQYYRDLPDAIEIARATKSWLAVRPVRNPQKVRRLRREKKIDPARSTINEELFLQICTMRTY